MNERVGMSLIKLQRFFEFLLRHFIFSQSYLQNSLCGIEDKDLILVLLSSAHQADRTRMSSKIYFQL